jgi:hypothetical protein
MWTVTLNKHRATWHFFTGNPQGGGFGSSHCGTQRVALAMAIQNIPAGAQYQMTVNGKDRGLQTR